MDPLIAIGAFGVLAIVSAVVLLNILAHLRARTAEAGRVRLIINDALADLNQGEYIAQSELEAWKRDHTDALRLAYRGDLANRLPPHEAAAFRRLCSDLQDLKQLVLDLNTTFVATRMKEDHKAFDQVESYPLTDNQRRSIVTNQDTTLVIAGAGTGKTSTIIGKVDYLVRRGLATPSEILVLAFGRQASEELKERLERFGAAGSAEIRTFHGLGYHIVGAVDGRRPSLSKMAEDPEQLKRFLRDRVRAMLATPYGQELLSRWFAHYLDEIQPGKIEFTGDELIRAEQALGLRAISGDKVKSRQEVQIANWLTLNGIAWEYERPYPIDTATPWRRAYRPDFYLPDYDLYLEHFGINRDGSTAPNVQAEPYRLAMEWKRELHRQHGTRLVETYSYHKDEGGLIANLSRLLYEQGVRPRPLTQDEIDEITADANRRFSDFVTLVAQFLAVYKGNGGDQESTKQRARTERDRVFLDVFNQLHEAYSSELERHREIDFNDMINAARHHVQSGRFQARYKYIIIDEFQDISENRLGLLQDLRAQTPHGRVFAVGDDWQSIYRFTGSDINIMTNLSSRVGATARIDLDVSFRYQQELLDMSAAFITKNPDQLRKTIRAHAGYGMHLPLTVIFEHRSQDPDLAGAEDPEQTSRALDQALGDIAARADGAPATVLVLGRYHLNKPDDFADLRHEWKARNVNLEYFTAHASKGKEADYVVVLGVKAGEYGFPSNVADDAVMKMVLADAEAYAHAEERRLFYVAMTRARRHVYVIAPNDRASPFIMDDLLREPLNAYVETIGELSARHRCPTCEGTTIRRTEGQYGAFWACANYPLCHGRLDACPYCKTGCLIQQIAENVRSYRCTGCRRVAELCPQCRVGYLRPRTSEYGEFLGCSRWNGGAGCKFTRKQ